MAAKRPFHNAPSGGGCSRTQSATLAVLTPHRDHGHHPFDSPSSRPSIEPVLRRQSCFTPDIGSRSPRRSPPRRLRVIRDSTVLRGAPTLIGPWGFLGVRGPFPNSISPVFIRSGPSGIGIFPGRKYGREQQFVIFPSFLEVPDQKMLETWR